MKNIDWGSLGFGYTKTDYNVRVEYKDGKWGDITVTDSEYINVHMSSSSLHYGSQIFEGLKAFTGIDGKVRLFRPEENALRFQRSASRLCMAEVPVDLFVEACKKVIEVNKDYVPPYGSGATLYLRPMLIAHESHLSISAAHEFLFCIFACPIGPYVKSGVKPMDVVIDVDHDRAAPRGTGSAKCGGNYAASIKSASRAKENGFASVIYLDATERRYIEECGAANFFGIKEGSYVTPESPSILKSITNKSICTLAEEIGLTVERRNIPIEELPTFDECGACGTAMAITPISSIYEYRTKNLVEYSKETGPITMKLYTMLQDIQFGRVEDRYNWCMIIE